VVQITAIPNVAQMVGVNRILVGNSVTCLVGNSQLTKEQEKALRKRIIIKALELLGTPVEGPTVWVYE
jgi:glycine reductase complex component B subunit gamma